MGQGAIVSSSGQLASGPWDTQTCVVYNEYGGEGVRACSCEQFEHLRGKFVSAPG